MSTLWRMMSQLRRGGRTAVVVSIALAGLIACSPSDLMPEIEADEDEQRVAVEIEVAEATGIRDAIYLTGEIEPTRTVEIMPEQAGRLDQLHIEIGDRVRRDQEIAVVDPSRPGQRFAPNPVKSPIDGTVVQIAAREGSEVTQQQPIARVATTADLEITTFVPERRIGTLTVGQRANVQLAAYPDLTLEARVSRVAPVLDAGSRSLETTLRFTRNDGRIRAGMFARIDLIVDDRPDAITVPQRSVLRRGGETYVYVADSDDRTQRRDVTTGVESGGRVEIREGLSAGDRVIVRGQNLVQPGSLLNVIDSAEASED